MNFIEDDIGALQIFSFHCCGKDAKPEWLKDHTFHPVAGNGNAYIERQNNLKLFRVYAGMSNVFPSFLFVTIVAFAHHQVGMVSESLKAPAACAASHISVIFTLRPRRDILG